MISISLFGLTAIIFGSFVLGGISGAVFLYFNINNVLVRKRG